MARDIIVCHECDEICEIPHPMREGRYKCPNCKHTLVKIVPNMIEKIYALNLSALILFGLSLYFPFLTFEVMGNHSEANYTTAVLYLYQDGDYLIAVTLLMTTVIVPLFRILLFLSIFAPLYHGKIPKYTPTFLRIIEDITPWGMLDVFLVGILVSIVKLIKMGTIIPDISLWAFLFLIPVLAYSQMIFDSHPVWEMVEDAQKEGKLPYPAEYII